MIVFCPNVSCRPNFSWFFLIQFKLSHEECSDENTTSWGRLHINLLKIASWCTGTSALGCHGFQQNTSNYVDFLNTSQVSNVGLVESHFRCCFGIQLQTPSAHWTPWLASERSWARPCSCPGNAKNGAHNPQAIKWCRLAEHFAKPLDLHLSWCQYSCISHRDCVGIFQTSEHCRPVHHTSEAY